MACAALLLLALTGARAQEVRLGLRGGATFGFLNDSPVPFVSEQGVTAANTNVRLDYHAGLHAIVPVADAYALQPEVLFVRKGAHLSRHGEGIYISERYQLSYVQAHLLARRHIALPGPLSLHGVVGPTVERATGGIVRHDIRTHSYILDQRIPLLEHDLIRRWNVGVLLGIGVEYPVGGTGTVSLDLRYNAGFRTVFTEERRSQSDRRPYNSDPPPLTESPPPLRHDVIMASLTFTMPLSGF